MNAEYCSRVSELEAQHRQDLNAYALFLSRALGVITELVEQVKDRKRLIQGLFRCWLSRRIQMLYKD